MSFLTKLFPPTTKVKVALAKEAIYDEANERLKNLEISRELMREHLSQMLKQVIEERK